MLRQLMLMPSPPKPSPNHIVITVLFCQACGTPGAKYSHQNTAYQDEESNWATLCDSCQDLANDFWRERWDEFYSNR